VPNPPDKGEKIRAFHQVRFLAGRCRLHVACFARSPAEVEDARRLSEQCASVHAERLPPWAMGRALARFLAGGSLTMSLYESRSLRRYVALLVERVRPAAAVVYTVPMASYVPPALPMVLDLVDVDSEKWVDYALLRRPRLLFSAEAARLRGREADLARRARSAFLTTDAEVKLFRERVANLPVIRLENGVDCESFDPAAVLPLPRQDARWLVMTGAMDYYPNSDAACRFAREIFADLRRRDARWRFWVVGRNPTAAVRGLREIPGVHVTGAVEDIRPYLRTATAVVAPLRLARGIQNKVLEALAMGKPVLASGAVCRTFGDDLPPGLVGCDSPDDYVAALEALGGGDPDCDPRIRQAACRRFSWGAGMEILWRELLAASEAHRTPAAGIGL
jgi:sugar transferase (PEP-CTERM/EpsH1 system associated)